MKPLDIGIVGGSLGGLFAAALLERDGHRVTVYERSSAGLAGRGAGLVQQADLVRILKRLGLEGALRLRVTALERIVLDRSGSVLQLVRAPQSQLSWDNLYRCTGTAITSGSYRLGSAVERVEAQAGRPRLYLAGGAQEQVDLVIGADGIGSVVRASVSGSQNVSRYAGYVAWRGIVPESALPAVAAEALIGRFAFHSEPGSHALGYLVPGADGQREVGRRRYNWVWYRQVPAEELTALLTDRDGRRHPFSLAPGQLPDQRREALLADARSLLTPQFAAAIETEPHPFVQAIFDYRAPRMVADRVALLGDAAFVIRPHTAMGVAKAAGDAMALRDLLAASPLQQALAAYEAERRPVGLSLADYGQLLGVRLGLDPSTLQAPSSSRNGTAEAVR